MKKIYLGKGKKSGQWYDEDALKYSIKQGPETCVLTIKDRWLIIDPDKDVRSVSEAEALAWHQENNVAVPLVLSTLEVAQEI